MTQPPERYPHYARYGIPEVLGTHKPYSAACRCGWEGVPRDSRRAADDDGTEHTKVHNDLDLEDNDE